MTTTKSTAWLAIGIAHAAVAANLVSYTRSHKWDTAFRAKSALSNLDDASRADAIEPGDGSIYRRRAARHICGIAADLRRQVCL